MKYLPFLLLFMFMVFCSFSYIVLNTKTKEKYYTDVSHQIIRQCIRSYGPFSNSNIPWITSFKISFSGGDPEKNIVLTLNNTTNSNMIIKSLIHQMAHIYSGNSHDTSFFITEDQLLDSAKKLGYYDSIKSQTIECSRIKNW